MWVSTMTRPDIANAFRALATLCENPESTHCEAAVTALYFFLATLSRGITFDGMCGEGKVQAYVDADHATDLDARRSVSGGVVMPGLSAISWFSTMQKVSALSTTEAEYITQQNCEGCIVSTIRTEIRAAGIDSLLP